jgi:hypothetical protein
MVLKNNDFWDLMNAKARCCKDTFTEIKYFRPSNELLSVDIPARIKNPV